jgi:thiamine biosynthesis lipoprotein
MGTFVEVASPDRRAAGIAFAEIRRIERLLSKYDPESEVSRLNRAGRLQVSRETFYLIQKAKDFSQASGGAFDITVGPLVDLWGFSSRNYRLPSAQEIASALKCVGAEKIILRPADNVVEFTVSGVKIDLGGIGKGYALDCAAQKLKAAGVASCLINAGGQVLAVGDNAGAPWRVAIRSPRGQGVRAFLALRNGSVSTSGDYQHYFVSHGRRYSHIIDPRSGYPAQSGVTAVTIIAADGMTADALSTAVFVLGKEKGAALAAEFPQARIARIEEGNG